MDFLDIIGYYTNRLNANANGVVFEGGYLIQTAGDNYQYQNTTNYYTEETVNYVPVTFGFIGEPEVLPTQDIINWNILVTMDLEGDYDTDPILVAQVKSIEEFRAGLEQNSRDTLEGYRIATKVSPFSKDEHVTRAGKKRISVSFELDVTTGIGIFFGNDVIYTLGLLGAETTIELQASITSLGAIQTTESDLTVNNAITKSTNEDATLQYELSKVFLNTDLDNELLKSLNGLNKVNTKYSYKEQWPLLEIPKTLIVKGGTIRKLTNDIILLNVIFTEST